MVPILSPKNSLPDEAGDVCSTGGNRRVIEAVMPRNVKTEVECLLSINHRCERFPFAEEIVRSSCSGPGLDNYLFSDRDGPLTPEPSL